MLSDHFKHEARSAFRFHHLALFAGCVVMSIGTSFLLPSMPETIYRFFKKVFVMDNWTEIILMNDLMGVFFALFWIGVIDLLRVYVLPKEEGYISLLLAKPLSRTRYLLMRVSPIFASVVGMGTVLSLFLPLKIALINGAADLHPAEVICAGILTTTLALALIALLNLIFLFAGETYYAVLLAFLLFALVVLPAGVFMYRPDVFETQAALRAVLVFPGNLLWFSASLPRLTPFLALLAVVLSALLLAGSGWRLKKMDVS